MDKRIVISIPRIIGWAKRQPPGKIVGLPGRCYDCIVAKYIEETYGVNASVTPAFGVGRAHVRLWTGQSGSPGYQKEFRELSEAVGKFAEWFDHRFQYCVNVSAEQLLDAWG